MSNKGLQKPPILKKKKSPRIDTCKNSENFSNKKSQLLFTSHDTIAFIEMVLMKPLEKVFQKRKNSGKNTASTLNSNFKELF